MKYTIYLLLLFCFTACEQLPNNAVETDLIRIYVNDKNNNKNALATQSFITTDDRIIVFGVWGENVIETAFEAEGKLYILILDNNGNYINELFLNPFTKGFPADIVQEGNSFKVFWNEEKNKPKVIDIDILETGEITTNITELNMEYHDLPVLGSGYMAAVTKSKNGYLLLNITELKASDDRYKKIIVTELNYDLSVRVKKKSEQIYNQDDFGDFGKNDLSFFIQFQHFFKIHQQQNNTYITASENSLFSFKSTGNSRAVFSDPNYAILAVDSIGDNAVSFLTTNYKNAGSPYLVKNIDLYATKKEYSSLTASPVELINMNPSEKFFLNIDYQEKKYVIAGTSNSGSSVILSVIGFDSSTPKNIQFGNTYTYKIASLLQTADRNSFIIIGTTRVAYNLERVFIIKIKKSNIY